MIFDRSLLRWMIPAGPWWFCRALLPDGYPPSMRDEWHVRCIRRYAARWLQRIVGAVPALVRRCGFPILARQRWKRRRALQAMRRDC